MIACELYRRRGAWKVRAVGQGYVQGLAGIATDFGISVDDDPEGRSADGAVEGFQADPLAAPTDTSSTPDASARHGAPDHPAHPTEQPARFGTPTIDLSKGRVVLRKKQTVSLTTRDAPPLSRVRMGLGWDPAVHGHNIDLDASVIAYDARGKKLINVWFMRQQAFGGAVRHSGDNLTGHGEGDDEVISVDLPALPGEVHALVFTVNSFAGHKFNQVGRAYCRLVDDVGGAELVRFELSRANRPPGCSCACSPGRRTAGT
ncbi:TerD family protein [Nocardia thailandica]|uniref:TerD family protein n=1 Tax=Nocardia thailandica TaxID=257275 RepID=UPI00031C059C